MAPQTRSKARDAKSIPPVPNTNTKKSNDLVQSPVRNMNRAIDRKSKQYHQNEVLSLKDIHRYRDSSGRTSCATTRLEHYRLRMVGLTRNLALTNSLIPRIERMLRVLRSKSSAALGRGNVDEADTYIRNEFEEAEKKRKRLIEQVERVILIYSKLLQEPLCAGLRWKLHPESRQMVYKYMLDNSRLLRVGLHEASIGRGDLRPDYHDRKLGDRLVVMPLICKSEIVGEDLAVDVLETFFQNNRFQLIASTVSNFLDKPTWGAMSAKRAVRNVEIEISHFDYITEPAAADKLRYYLTPLQGLQAGKVSVELVLQSPRHPSRPALTRKSVKAAAEQESADYRREMSEVWWTIMNESISRAKRRDREDKEWHLRVIMGVLLPDLACLVNKGHSVTLKGKLPDWEYSLDAEHLTIDETMRHWRKSVGETL